ncbi:Histidine phosphatase superfamily clade-2 [Penicillium herquei]|nr:Histidine phosphatase superfamily clade-2 [Penicillium herquei]
MFTLKLQFLALAILLLTAPTFTKAEYTEKVWSVFAYTVYGDSTPMVLIDKQPPGLTEYGGSQLADVGSAFRNRYVSSAGSSNATESAIQYISPSVLYSKDVRVLSTTDQNVIASAQAFMVGLYPPLGQEHMNTSDETANGTIYSAPLDGYQFPQIVTAGDSDPASLLVSGQSACNMHQVGISEYQNSDNALEITRDSEVFYQKLLHQVLSGVYDKSSATYANAVSIADYLNYEIIHNSTALDHLFGDDLIRARSFADQFTYATNAQDASALTSESTIGAASPIAGQTLASSILDAFRINMEEEGNGQKITLLFGGDEPAVALASLIGLASTQQSNFYSRPARGASLIFELYSFETDVDDESYPGSDEMYVRFFLHNGTDSSTEFISYPLFGYGPSKSYVPWNDFEIELETFAVASIQEWCIRCNADSVFCSGVLDRNDSSTKKRGISPVVAGVIGAVVTLVVIGLLATLGFFLCSLRKRRGSHRPSMGGFKGTSKLASDTDVSFRNPIWGSGKSAPMEQDNEVSSGVIVRGQERLGSWEMGQQISEIENTQPITSSAAAHVSNMENEPEWSLHTRLQPVKVRETV